MPFGWLKTPQLLEIWFNRAIGKRDLTDAPVLAFDEYKVAYLPMPKAANTSIRTALLPYLSVEDQGHSKDIHNRTRSLLEPSSSFFKRANSDWYVFTVVRDPSSRAKSAWRNKLIERDPIFVPLQRMGIKERIEFEPFLRKCSAWPQWALNDHFMPQTMLLDRASKSGLLNVFHFENLSDDWLVIKSELAKRGMTEVADLKKLNTTAKAADQFTVAELDLLADLYGTDFKELGYDLPQASKP